MLTLLGYEITEAARQAGRVAMGVQVKPFTAHEIAPAILPHIGQPRVRWPGASQARAALALADELIWEANRAGTVKPGGVGLTGARYWCLVAPRRTSGGA